MEFAHSRVGRPGESSPMYTYDPVTDSNPTYTSVNIFTTHRRFGYWKIHSMPYVHEQTEASNLFWKWHRLFVLWYTQWSSHWSTLGNDYGVWKRIIKFKIISFDLLIVACS